MSRVAGAMALTGAAAAVTGCATTERTGWTDRDAGRWGDVAGNGRGPNAPRGTGTPQSRTSVTDIDPGDRPGQGRGGNRGTCTDSDTQATNQRTDLAGRGRRC